MVEDITELFDFSTTHAFERPQQATSQSNRVGHVAKHEFDWRVASVDLTIQFLAVATARELYFLGTVAFFVDAGCNRQKLNVAVKAFQFIGYTGDANSTQLRRFFGHSFVRFLAT